MGKYCASLGVSFHGLSVTGIDQEISQAFRAITITLQSLS